MSISVLGIDIAKQVFELHGVDGTGKVVFKKSISREKLSAFIVNLPPCLIGMEACGGSHFQMPTDRIDKPRFVNQIKIRPNVGKFCQRF